MKKPEYGSYHVEQMSTELITDILSQKLRSIPNLDVEKADYNVIAKSGSLSIEHADSFQIASETVGSACRTAFSARLKPCRTKLLDCESKKVGHEQ